MAKKDITRAPSTPDRISNLPDHVVAHILKWLPMQDSVRTSILSKEWRYKWVTTPHLVFDWNFKKLLNGKHDPESIIGHILSSHKGTVVKFTFWNPDLKTHPAIDSWVHFLSNHPIENLKLSLSPSSSGRPLPPVLYSLDNLKELYLSRVEIKPPCGFKGFSKLVKLYLVDVVIQHEDLKRFISHCPVLEFLSMSNSQYDKLLDLQIDAPNVKIFRFSGAFSSISFKKSKFEELEIRDHDNMYVYKFELTDSDWPKTNNMIKVFNQLPCLKRLVLNNCFLQYLGATGVPLKLPHTLNNLTFLKIMYMESGNLSVLHCALCLIRSSPNMQNLEVIFENVNNQSVGEATAEYLKEEQKSIVPLRSLKNIKVQDLMGTQPQMEFVKLLLLSETVLRKLEVHTFVGNRDQVFEELASFCRATSSAVIKVE